MKENHKKDIPPAGIIAPLKNKRKYTHDRYIPSPSLAAFIEHYWFVQWHLPAGERFVQQTLPHPCVHLVFEANESRLVGLMTRHFARTLQGSGKVVGIKFKPGAFYCFHQQKLSALTDALHNGDGIFGKQTNTMARFISAQNDHKVIIKQIEGFLLSLNPAFYENFRIVETTVKLIQTDKLVKSVDQLCHQLGVGKRKLQRIFQRHVGVGPKWLIQRYRMFDILDFLHAENKDWNMLLSYTGYNDQSHFIKDFKRCTGLTPGQYLIANR